MQSNTIIQQLQQLTEEKNNIMKQLDQTSQIYFKERDEKKLENKIEILNNNFEQYKNNYKNNIEIEKTPEFISALEKKQNSLLKEFDIKLQEFQRESNKNINVNNNKEEIERYKQLILKEREMMSTLTNKINEREETILQLQEDNKVFEKINEQQDNYIFLLNKNFKNLIEYCQQKIKNDDVNIENYLNIYNKINNDINNNKLDNNNKNNNTNNNIKDNNNKSINTKKYLPYNYKNNNNMNNKNYNSSFNSSNNSILNNVNINNDNNPPLSLLSADEK